MDQRNEASLDIIKRSGGDNLSHEIELLGLCY